MQRVSAGAAGMVANRSFCARPGRTLTDAARHAGRLRAGETPRRGFPGGHAGLRPSGAPPRPQWGVDAGRC